MKRFLNYILYSVVIGVLYSSCKESFTPPDIVDSRHYLVVEGFINTGEGPTTFTLTRTRNLSDTGAIHNVSGVPDSIFVDGATVLVEDDAGNASPLPALGKGRYGGNQLYLDNQKKYRLYVKTGNGKEYASEYVPVLHTPPVGDIGWRTVQGDGLHISVSTDENAANNKYYRWTYSETWEFHTAYFSEYRYDPEDSMLKKRSDQELVYHCWQSDESHNILVATSDQLKSTELKNVDLTVVPYHDEKASILYSILVNQMAISKEEYEFWLINGVII